MAIVDARALQPPVPLLLDGTVWIAATTGTSGVVAPEVLLILEQGAQENRLFASAATVWELSLLDGRGVLKFGDLPLWLADQTRPPGVTLLPITGDIAYECTRLPMWSPAPQGVPPGHALSDGHIPSYEAIDRFIIATARRHDCVIVTTDLAILAYAHYWSGRSLRRTAIIL